MFFSLLCPFFVVGGGDYTTQNVPQNIVLMCCLAFIPKWKNSVMCLMEKMHVLDNIPSGMNCSIVAPDFNINESTIYIGDFPGGPEVKTSSSKAEHACSISGRKAKIPYASGPRNQNIKQSNILTNSIKTLKMVLINSQSVYYIRCVNKQKHT